MVPYFFLLILLIMFAGGSQLINGSLGVRILSVGTVAIILILFQGLRSIRVGTDTGNYVGMFYDERLTSNIWWSTEIGYTWLNAFLANRSDDYSTLLLGISVIVVSFYVMGIWKMTKQYGLALFLFVTLGVYTFSFNGARQGIAAAICFFALQFLIQRRAISYFAMIAFAALFHHTAIIAAPLYAIARKKLHWYHFIYLFIGTSFITASLANIVQLSTLYINDSYATYADQTQGGGEYTLLFLISQGLALYVFRPRRTDDLRVYNYLLSVYVIGLVPAAASVIASLNPSGFLRLHIYFTHTAILLWPMALKHIRNGNQRLALFIGLVLFMLLFFYLTTSSFSRLTPYTINEWFSYD